MVCLFYVLRLLGYDYDMFWCCIYFGVDWDVVGGYDLFGVNDDVMDMEFVYGGMV